MTAIVAVEIVIEDIMLATSANRVNHTLLICSKIAIGKVNEKEADLTLITTSHPSIETSIQG